MTKWVQKQVRKSTSTVTLLRRLDAEASEPHVEADPIAWATDGEEIALEAVKEGKTIARSASIQQLLADHDRRKRDDALWAFLG